jgi:hypothetical protein
MSVGNTFSKRAVKHRKRLKRHKLFTFYFFAVILPYELIGNAYCLQGARLT